MANGRFLSRSIAKDRRLNALSVESSFLFLMTIPHLDRDGMIGGDTLELWATVAPLQSSLRDRIDDLVEEWKQSGLVSHYEVKGCWVLWFPGFQKNQQGMIYKREGVSKFPAPPGFVRTETGLVASTHELVASTYAEVEDQPEEKSSRSQQQPATKPNGNTGLIDDFSLIETAHASFVGAKVSLDQAKAYETWLKITTPAAIVAALQTAKSNGVKSPFPYAMKILENQRKAGELPGNGPRVADFAAPIEITASWM